LGINKGYTNQYHKYIKKNFFHIYQPPIVNGGGFEYKNVITKCKKKSLNMGGMNYFLMEYSFTAWGHENVTGKHKRTLEFTKEHHLSIQGDCILGVSASFSIYDLKELIKEGTKMKIVMTADDISDEVSFQANPAFDDDKEIVIRLGDFSSDRTFGINADKACIHLKRELIEKLKNPEQKINVLIANV
jgi:hypothetical protein